MLNKYLENINGNRKHENCFRLVGGESKSSEMKCLQEFAGIYATFSYFS